MMTKLDDITFKAYESYAYGYADPRAFDYPKEDRWYGLAATLFRTEAESRGYCMKLWDSRVPKGWGEVQYGRIT